MSATVSGVAIASTLQENQHRLCKYPDTTSSLMNEVVAALESAVEQPAVFESIDPLRYEEVLEHL